MKRPQTPAHWSGTEPPQVLAPDGNGGRRPRRRPRRRRRSASSCDGWSWRAGWTASASRCSARASWPSTRGFEGQEAAQVGSAAALGARRLRLPDLPRARGRAGPRRRHGRVPRLPPRHVARRPVRPRATPVRADVRPDRQPDRCTRSGYAHGRTARRAARRARSPTSATARRARATSTRRANFAGVFRAPGDPVLPEQRVGDQRARRAADRGADLAQGRGLRVPRRAGGRERRAGGVRGVRAGRRAGARRRGTDADRGADVPDRRALHRRRRRRATARGPRSRPGAHATRSSGTAPGSRRAGLADDSVPGRVDAEARRSRSRSARASCRGAAPRRSSGCSTGCTRTAGRPGAAARRGRSR